MLLTIITPTKKYFEGEVKEVYAPGDDGCFGILENHAPFLSTLKNGEVKVITTDNNTKIFNISGGLADVSNNKVKILAETVSE